MPYVTVFQRNNPDRQQWMAGAALVLLVLAVFHPVWKAGYIWDDDSHLTNNACIVGPKGFWDIWTSSEARICPLVLSSFWVLKSLFGLHPLPFHLATLAFHAASAVVLWQILQKLKVPGAWLGAALWSLHPVQVESVAWISELKNTQSGFFYLLAVQAFLNCLAPPDDLAPTKREPGMMLLYATLAMASKSSTVILPVVLGLCAWWVDGRWRWQRAKWIVPVLGLSVLAGALTLWTHSKELSHADIHDARSLMEKVATAGNAVWFYLGKLIWPDPLLTVYPGWEPGSNRHSVSLVGAAAVVLVLAVLWWLRRGRWRGLFFAYAIFLAGLIPVLGFINQSFIARYAAVADRYEYLPSMGPLALVAAGLALLPSLGRLRQPRLAEWAGAALLCVLGLLSWRQTRCYESSDRLWARMIAKSPMCWVAYNSLGMAKLQQGDFNGAIADWTRELELAPDDAATESNLGAALRKVGRLDEGIAHCRKAIALAPTDAAAQNGLANALRDRGRIAEAVVHYESALELDPRAVPVANNLAWVLAACPDDRIRNPDHAVKVAEQAVQLTGGADAIVLRTLAAAYASAGRFEDAGKTLDRAMSRTQPVAQANLMQALLMQKSKYRQSVPEEDLSLVPR